MTRGVRKAASDSTEQILKDARASDRTALQAPDIPGSDILNEKGRDFFNRLYRSAPDKWSEADLFLMVEAAHAMQRLTANRYLMALVPSIITHKNGLMGRHPQHLEHFELTRQVQTLLRDLGIRSKDGMTAAVETTAPDQPLNQPSTYSDFESWCRTPQ